MGAASKVRYPRGSLRLGLSQLDVGHGLGPTPCRSESPGRSVGSACWEWEGDQRGIRNRRAESWGCYRPNCVPQVLTLKP